MTLLELLVVVAIIGGVLALSHAGLSRRRSASSLVQSANDFAAAVRRAAHESISRREAVVIVLSPGTDPDRCSGSLDDTRCTQYFVLVDDVANGGPAFVSGTLGEFRPENPSSFGDAVIASGSFQPGTFVGTATGLIGPPFAAPYDALVADGGCAFCLDGEARGRGFIRFDESGEASVAGSQGFTGSTLFLTTSSRRETAVVGVALPSGRVMTTLAP